MKLRVPAVRKPMLRADGRIEQRMRRARYNDHFLMLTFEECRRLAACWVEVTSRGSAIIVDDATVMKPYGWIFFYESRAYLETGNFTDVLAGNAPLIIDRFDGELRVTGTERSVEEYLSAYEATLPPARLR